MVLKQLGVILFLVIVSSKYKLLLLLLLSILNEVVSPAIYIDCHLTTFSLSHSWRFYVIIMHTCTQRETVKYVYFTLYIESEMLFLILLLFNKLYQKNLSMRAQPLNYRLLSIQTYYLSLKHSAQLCYNFYFLRLETTNCNFFM